MPYLSVRVSSVFTSMIVLDFSGLTVAENTVLEQVVVAHREETW